MTTSVLFLPRITSLPMSFFHCLGRPLYGQMGALHQDFKPLEGPHDMFLFTMAERVTRARSPSTTDAESVATSGDLVTIEVSTRSLYFFCPIDIDSWSLWRSTGHLSGKLTEVMSNSWTRNIEPAGDSSANGESADNAGTFSLGTSRAPSPWLFHSK